MYPHEATTIYLQWNHSSHMGDAFMVIKSQVESSCLEDYSIGIGLFITSPYNLSYSLLELKKNDNFPCNKS